MLKALPEKQTARPFQLEAVPQQQSEQAIIRNYCGHGMGKSEVLNLEATVSSSKALRGFQSRAV